MDGFHRGWCVLLACCAASLLLSGCWSRNEINDIAVVTAIGIDKQKDQYTVSLQVPISIPAAAACELYPRDERESA